MLRVGCLSLISSIQRSSVVRLPVRMSSSVIHNVSANVESKLACLSEEDQRALEMGIPLLFGHWHSPYFVVNKPVGIPTHAHNRDSLQTRLEYILGNGTALHPVHRLDKYTSGAIMVACNPEAAALLSGSMSKFSVVDKKKSIQKAHTVRPRKDTPGKDSSVDPVLEAAIAEFPELVKETFGVVLQKRYRALLRRPVLSASCEHGTELTVNPHISGGVLGRTKNSIVAAGGISSYMQRRSWLPVEWASQYITPRTDDLDLTKFYHTEDKPVELHSILSLAELQKAPFEWLNETLAGRDSILDQAQLVLDGKIHAEDADVTRDDVTGEGVSVHHNVGQFSEITPNAMTKWHPSEWRNLRVRVNSRDPSSWPQTKQPCGCNIGYVGYAENSAFIHYGNLIDLNKPNLCEEDHSYILRSQPHPFIPHIVQWESVPKDVFRPISKTVPISFMQQQEVTSTRENVHKQYTHAMHGPKEALTRFRVDEQTDTTMLVSASLLTGRTHQLRVHFADAGAPILGDIYYNYDSINHWKHEVSQNRHESQVILGHSRLGMSEDGDGSMIPVHMTPGTCERKHIDPMMGLQAYLLEFSLPVVSVSSSKSVVTPGNNPELFWRLRREAIERQARMREQSNMDPSGLGAYFYNQQEQTRLFWLKFMDPLSKEEQELQTSPEEQKYLASHDTYPLYNEVYNPLRKHNLDMKDMQEKQKAYNLQENAKLTQKLNLNDVSACFDELYSLQDSVLAEMQDQCDIRMHSQSATNAIWQIIDDLVQALGGVANIHPLDKYVQNEKITLSGDSQLHLHTQWTSWTYTIEGKGTVGRVVVHAHEGWSVPDRFSLQSS